MADNYLERRMEEHLSGRDGATGPRARSRAHTSGINTRCPDALAVPGKAILPFAPLRVFIAGNTTNCATDIAGLFADLGCRVATALPADADGDSRFRRYLLDTTDTESFRTAFESLLKAWRDTDLVIAMDADTANVIADVWDNHHRRFPVVTDYGCRLILVGADSSTISNVAHNSFSLNAVSVANRNTRDILAAILFAALPHARVLNGLVI